MNHQKIKPFYKFPPVRKLSVLAKLLSVSEKELIYLANHADGLYKAGQSLAKTDGTFRETFNAKPRLKIVQGRIKSRILDKVEYPFYLQGGIKDKDNPRDYVRNASIHAGSVIIINEDIGSFFPSISTDIVLDIWRNFFHFSEEVAECLVRLTTKHGTVPQGARTSSHLANLVFWRQEYKLVGYFSGLGLLYTRLIDDITVSSKCRLNNESKSEIIQKIYSMLWQHGFKPKREKHSIRHKGQRMLVNKLVVNKKPSLPKEKKSALRACIKKCRESTVSDEFYHKVLSRVGQLKRFSPDLAMRLRRKLLQSRTSLS